LLLLLPLLQLLRLRHLWLKLFFFGFKMRLLLLL
jgi:hypothetical protein